MYFKEFISDEEWSNVMTAGKGTIVNSSRHTVAAPMVAMSETERRANEIIANFQQMLTTNKVESQYFGRHLDDLETVKLLRTIAG